MKKIIAIVMAVVMMMAIAVPAFAAGVNPITNETTDQYGTADVYTKTTDASGKDVWSYTITIPADMDIAWNDDTVKDMTYYVKSQLLIGASLKISVAGSSDAKLTASSGDKLAYTLIGGGEVVFGAVNAENTTAPGVTEGTNVQVKIPSFEGVPVGEYRDTLTFTVVYVAPETTA